MLLAEGFIFCFIKKYKIYTKYKLNFLKDEQSFRYIFLDNMLAKETVQSVVVNRGDNLILNCTCFNECNGQWSGPNTILVPNAGAFIPYTQGLNLNPRLNQSKYRVFGGYDTKKCNLHITKFVSDDDGAYQCQYVQFSTVYTDVYHIFTTSTYYL